ncbi:MAG: EAL and HDOD domain-containing protein [Halorhodospira sp.]
MTAGKAGELQDRSTVTHAGEVRIARQPIYDRDLNVCGYELLYRQGDATSANHVNDDAATASVMDNALTSFGLEQITGGKPAYINLTRRFFMHDLLIPFQKDQVVLELLEDIEPDDELIAALRRLSKRGFHIALDDYMLNTDERHRLFPYCDMIKVDVLNMSYREVVAHTKQLIRPGAPSLLAEKVETQEMMDLCRKAGFSYFQGFFLSRPTTLSSQSLSSRRLPLLQLVAALHKPELNIKEVETIIARDLSLTYKLLRYLSSPVFAARNINSVRSAILYLGSREIAHWAVLLAMAAEDDQPAERIRSLLIRAYICEQLTRHRYGGSDAEASFTIGLFSGLDAVFDAPIEQICEQLPLNDESEQALIHATGPYGSVLAATIAQEQADWERLARLEIPPRQLNHFYLEAVRWADEHYDYLERSARAG